MPYDLSVLSPTQFESLSADLVGRDISARFEQFGEGPDGGIDGRHAKGPDKTILQAKHFARSGYSKLKSELRKERAKIDQLHPTRYILSTSVSMTPTRKSELMEIIGPSCLEPGDIFGAEDLHGLLRNNSDLVKAHPDLWKASGTVLKEILHETLDERESRHQAPLVLQKLLPGEPKSQDAEALAARDTIFLLGSRPEDDEFILWLGPKLEANGFSVFSEILTLEPGHRWRRELNKALEHRAAKLLVAASAASAANEHVLDLIDKAREVGTVIDDAKFIIPLRLENGVKLDGLRDAVAVDFLRGWGDGLNNLLKALQRQSIPQNQPQAQVAPQWDMFRKRGAIPIVREPEQLVSNWLAVVEMPDQIHYYEASGVVREETLRRQIKQLSYPAKEHGRGVFSFADPHDIADSFADVARLKLHTSVPVDEFAEKGMALLGIKSRDAANMVTYFLREAWERHCKDNGMISYDFSGATAFHVSSDQVPNGQKIKWGQQGGGRRSSMLRNVANKHIWKYGVSALPRLWPFWHVRLKARVLFAEDNGTQEGKSIDDPKKMHRLRRSGCKGWRNKQWHGRLLAFLELMSAGSAFIRVPLAPGHDMLLSSEPIMFTSPVRTSLPDILDADGEEEDETTLGRPEVEVEDP